MHCCMRHAWHLLERFVLCRVSSFLSSQRPSSSVKRSSNALCLIDRLWHKRTLEDGLSTQAQLLAAKACEYEILDFNYSCPHAWTDDAVSLALIHLILSCPRVGHRTVLCAPSAALSLWI